MSVVCLNFYFSVTFSSQICDLDVLGEFIDKAYYKKKFKKKTGVTFKMAAILIDKGGSEFHLRTWRL